MMSSAIKWCHHALLLKAITPIKRGPLASNPIYDNLIPKFLPNFFLTYEATENEGRRTWNEAIVHVH